MARDVTGTAVGKLRDHAERERMGLVEERERQIGTRQRQAAWARKKAAEVRIVSPSEARKLAENLFGIVAGACSPRPDRGPVRKTAILEEANMRDSDGKSRVLYRYTLDPDLPEETRRQRGNRLIRHPANYLKIADAAARLAGSDADDVVCRLIAGTRLAEGMDTVPDDFEPEYLDMLARAIQGQASRIASETRLDWYFRTIEAHDLSPANDAWTADGLGSLLFHYTLPAVELFTLELPEPVYQGLWLLRRPDGSDGPEEIRTACPCLRVALTLAPLGAGREVRAYFMRRHVLTVRDLTEETNFSGKVEQLWGLNVDVVSWLGRKGKSGSDAGTFRVRDAELDRFVAEQGHIDLWTNHEFVEVTPASIAEMLGSKLPDVPFVRGDALGQAAMHVTKSPPGTRISVLEDVLHYGCDHDITEVPLMAMVEEDARHRVTSLRSWWDKEQAKIEDAFSRMASGGRP